MPEDRAVADGNHGFGPHLGFLAQPRPESTTKDKDWHVHEALIHEFPPRPQATQASIFYEREGTHIISETKEENQGHFGMLTDLNLQTGLPVSMLS
jgi:hypothetical protein